MPILSTSNVGHIQALTDTNDESHLEILFNVVLPSPDTLNLFKDADEEAAFLRRCMFHSHS